MLTAEQIYKIACEWGALMTPAVNIQWTIAEPYEGMWLTKPQQLPSVLDAVILERANAVPGYMHAAAHATGWSWQSIESFQKIMAIGHPRYETQDVVTELNHWKGLMTGVELYEIVKNGMKKF